MPLPTTYPPSPILLKLEPLTPSSFEPFGTVIATPIPQTLASFPSTIPNPTYPNQQPKPVAANQLTALKTSPVSPLINNYPVTGQGQEGGTTQSPPPPGKGLMSIFSSFPRRNVYLSGSGTETSTPKLKLGILERHPYTTQTFCPFNYSPPINSPYRHGPSNPSSNTSTTQTSKSKCYILIIVSPTLSSPNANPPNPPDLTRLRAFIYPLNDPTHTTPNVAITYDAGTWHAPMIVLGDHRVDFLVTQFANGVGYDDCQECLIGSGPDERVLDAQVRRERKTRRDETRDVEVDLRGVDVYVDDEDVEKGGVGGRDGGEKWTTDEMILRAVRASKL